MTCWTLSKVSIPLCILETIQRDAGDQFNGQLSEESLSALCATLKNAAWADIVTVTQVLSRMLPSKGDKSKSRNAQALLSRETVVIRAIARIVGTVGHHIDVLTNAVRNQQPSAEQK